MRKFTVIEHCSFYIPKLYHYTIRLNDGQAERLMGDGLNTLYVDGQVLVPGTPGFRESWEDAVNSDESLTMAEYFPEWVVEDEEA